MFYHDLPRDVARDAADRLRPQAYTFMHEVSPLTEWPDTESAYIVCNDDHALNPAWERQAARDRLDVEPLEIEEAHSPFLGRPSELADVLHSVTQ